MSDRPVSRSPRARAADHPSTDEVVNSVPVNTQEITGPVSTPNPTRGGDDTRRRGWFWHWNSIVTQYAPLIGLKGVGLLNSYTVWTDRREESPHRGYAFPSQQSEADFYGEDRAELITINKLLVALDLIEIRKEMVLRVDEQGRRWKVPHNFYRVKDHDDGSSLSSRDVLRVAELADRDAAVYRYVRRVFSPRFSPIDHNNVWARILDEVRQTEVWHRLATKAAKDEQRASDRTKAGHAARKGSFILPVDGDNATTGDGINDSKTGRSRSALATSVASTNNGSDPDVEESNNGLASEFTTSVDPVNTASPTDVEQTNRTYNQYPLTTTTTTPEGAKRRKTGTTGRGSDILAGANRPPVTTPEMSVTGQPGAGPNGQEPPSDAPGESRAIHAFEDANGRRATAAERHLLTGLSKRFDLAARSANVLHMESGWSWVTAGIYEAVEAGSTFVAPRRLREILARWERDGLPDFDHTHASGDRVITQVIGGQIEANPTPIQGERTAEVAAVDTADQDELLGKSPDFDLPHGFGSRRTWAFAVSLLGSALERTALIELVRGSAIVGYAHGEVTIAVPTSIQAEQLNGEYRDLVARKVSEAMRRPVRIAVSVPAANSPLGDESEGRERRSTPATSIESSRHREPETPNFIVAECGLPSAQVWAAVIDQVAADGDISRLNVETWLRSSQLVGRGADGSLIVGAAHMLAQRRITDRFAPALMIAVAAVLGAELPVEIVIAREWLSEHTFTPSDSMLDAFGAA